MTASRPPVLATLDWDQELRFSSHVGSHEIRMDAAGDAAATPVQLIAVSLAGCMAMDLVHILTRGRHAVNSLTASLTGERSDENPRRFTRIRLHFTLAGDMLPEHVERAIQLSREKYCSVWNTFRQDIDLEVGFTIAQ